MAYSEKPAQIFLLYFLLHHGQLSQKSKCYLQLFSLAPVPINPVPFKPAP